MTRNLRAIVCLAAIGCIAATDEIAYAPPSECDSRYAGLLYGEARGEKWFIDGEPIEIGGRRFVKYGLPRVLASSGLQAFASYREAGVFTAHNAGPAPEVIYLLLGAVSAASRDCEYQPYQAE